MAVVVYRCTLCGKDRAGRFTRPRQASGRGWSKGHTLPNWYCWTCLTLGEGRDEEAERDSPTLPVSSPGILGGDRAQAIKEAELVRATESQLALQVTKLTVKTPDAYLEADKLLGRIQTARRSWGTIWERLQEKVIKPIRSGLDELYSLNRDVDRPLEALEEAVKFKMKAYKLDEARLQREADEIVEQLRIQAESKALAEQQAKTEPMRLRLAEAREKLEQHAAAIEADVVPVRGDASRTRTTKALRVLEMRDFLNGIISGAIPNSVITLNWPIIKQELKNHPTEVAQWPGCEVFDDIQIVNR